MQAPKIKHLDEIKKLAQLAKKLSDSKLTPFQANRYKKMYINMLKSVGNIPAGLPSPNSFKVPSITLPTMPDMPEMPTIPEIPNNISIPPLPNLSGLDDIKPTRIKP